MKHGLNTDSKPTAKVGSEKILFDVPVYRLTKKEYESQQDAYICKNISDGNYSVQEMYRRHPDVKRQAENHLWESYGGSWLFNEIIGFIRLFFLSDQIRGEYFRVKAKKIVRTRRKIFEPLGIEITAPRRIPQKSSNQEIFDHIKSFLSRAQNENELKKHYVDTSVLEYIGSHMDWNALLEEEFKTK
jgi:hypothetical protein